MADDNTKMNTSGCKRRASRNRTLEISSEDKKRLQPILSNNVISALEEPISILLGDAFGYATMLPKEHFDLLFLDPPYNLNKDFNGLTFSKMTVAEYTTWLDRVFAAFKFALKPTATIYICGDWRSSPSIFAAASKHFIIQNRITWEREKGRGALRNWKNSSEDIWFCTMSKEYIFNVEAVKLRRRVIAPYTHADGSPKDWKRTDNIGFRDTHPSNIWTDITIPFWSMPENTDHPTQKSEKLLAKLLLASTNPDSNVLDPFLGSGTTCVVAKKLGRRALGIEINEEYALWAARRLELASSNQSIQGFSDGVFWERNTLANQLQNGNGKEIIHGDSDELSATNKKTSANKQLDIFGSSKP